MVSYNAAGEDISQVRRQQYEVSGRMRERIQRCQLQAPTRTIGRYPPKMCRRLWRFSHVARNEDGNVVTASPQVCVCIAVLPPCGAFIPFDLVPLFLFRLPCHAELPQPARNH